VRLVIGAATLLKSDETAIEICKAQEELELLSVGGLGSILHCLDLPHHFRHSRSLATFKTAIKTHLFKSAISL